MNNNYLQINEKDNVVVAVKKLEKGNKIVFKDTEIEIRSEVPVGHKIAIKNIKTGENIIKYGEAIGRAVTDIESGEHVHTENIKTNLKDIIDYKYNKQIFEFDYKNKNIPTFKGYVREDGNVGTRNDIWIVPTVGCINQTAKNLSKMAKEKYGNKVDDIVAITHDMGCSQLGDDLEITQKILAGIIKNPNAAGVLVLSLGCENNYLEIFKPFLGEFNKNRIKFLTIQNVKDEYLEAMNLLDELVSYASEFKREDVGIDKLKIGFKCGGSDAFSGITANVLSGKVNDEIVSYGGSTVISEVPEMFGAEHLLMARAKDKEVFNKIVNLINDYKNYFKKYNQQIYENPSPGNKKGGITTLEDKSLGCIQKGGSSQIVGVLDYGEQIDKPGFFLLNGSGNDQVSTTNLVASGVNLIVFTTGRGNPFGNIVPTIKLSSNTELAKNKPHWIDFDAGQLLNGINFKVLTQSFLDYIIKVASGELTNNEKNGFKSITIFKDGVIL
ncbi:UxaA family hydrolase [Miniphocaeibacter halophilus]|uniref:Altronate dehydratase n=1 Tax=Miniphocaeibacter halophilus TaxID=2931922 RepID=A0AC61MR30_9FIRM|nr:altronate dehydratase family protein [Miniphocaeibacter halophilus]QQK07783.1 altronate dehydratase [Miniphocaeibacter halophilus]